MVFFNYATMQMAAKIVYYGPGLCGKTTNLHHIYQKTAPQSRGEMVSLETETDRTLFFDLLPIDVGVIGGFKTRLQLYTVPGQVFYNTTRKLVLKGVDGIVFVADSQKAMLEANRDSFRNLEENLREIDQTVDDVPLVIQLNKRDLPNIADIDAMLDILDPARKFEHVQAIAASGVGVFETLKTISKLTIRTLRRRMTTDEPARPAPRKTISDFSQFKVNNEKTVDPGRTVAAMPIPPDALGTVIPESEPESPEPQVAAAVVETIAEPEPAVEAPPQADAFLEEAAVEESAADLFAPEPEPETAASESFDSVFDSEETPSTQYQPPAVEAEPSQEPEDIFSAGNEQLPEPAEAEPEPELVIPQVARASKAAPEVKHVKMRSNMDVMAELESLRKKATTPKAPKKDAEPLVLPKSKRDIQKSIQLSVAPDILARAKTLRLTVSFEDEAGVMQTEERSVDVADASDVQTLSVNLKIDLA
jgi:signal recognition particle receptor subunit beta